MGVLEIFPLVNFPILLLTFMLRRLELLPGVTPLFREHGRSILGTLSHFSALLPFYIKRGIFLIAGVRKTQANIYRHFISTSSSKYIVQ